jgi:hypothetical protein
MTKDELVAFLKKSPVALGCGVLSLGLIGALYFRTGEIPEAETRLAEKTAEAERYTLNIKNGAQLKEQLERLTAANKAIETHIVRASQLGANAQYFYNLESETGVKLVADPRQTTPATVAKPAKGSFVPVGFTVSVEGTFNQVLEFVRRLESGAHYSRVMTATCSVVSSKRNSPLTLALSLELLGQP